MSELAVRVQYSRDVREYADVLCWLHDSTSLMASRAERAEHYICPTWYLPSPADRTVLVVKRWHREASAFKCSIRTRTSSSLA